MENNVSAQAQIFFCVCKQHMVHWLFAPRTKVMKPVARPARQVAGSSGASDRSVCMPASAGYGDLTCVAAERSADAYLEPVADGELITDPMTDAQCVVSVASNGDATIAFRGSSSRADWVANLWYPLKSLPSPHRQSVKAHSGFLRQYLSVHAHIVRALEAAGARHVVLTGHSLGGALAVVAAAMLPSHYTYDVVTFGAPRAGNSELSDAAYHKCRSCVRVVHDRDVVPLVPLRAMGFDHVCEPWLLLDDNGDVYNREREYSLWQEFMVRMRGLISGDLGVSDHFMKWYMRGVRDDAEREPREAALEMQELPTSKVDKNERRSNAE